MVPAARNACGNGEVRVNRALRWAVLAIGVTSADWLSWRAMTTNDEIALLTATAIRGSAPPFEIAKRIGEARTYTVMLSGLRVAMDRKYPSGGGIDTVTDFVTELKGHFPDLPMLKTEVAEAVIWAALGNQRRLKEVDVNEAVVLLFFLTHVIMSSEDLDERGIAEYIARVLELAPAAAPTESS